VPITPGGLEVVAGSVTGSDNGSGSITGTGILPLRRQLGLSFRSPMFSPLITLLEFGSRPTARRSGWQARTPADSWGSKPRSWAPGNLVWWPASPHQPPPSTSQ
jgi:hypothetical protein